MATKKQDVLTLLDKAVGKKGPLRIPAYWMREVLLKIMDWAEGLTPKVNVPTKISQLDNDMDFVSSSYVNSKTNNAYNSSKSYTDTASNNTLSSAKSYTDSKINNNITNVLNSPI